MLLEFEVENFRSINNPVKLQMSAVNYYKESASQLIDRKLPGLSGVNYLRAAAIYGPNASGKTAIWRALSTMKDIVVKSASVPVDLALPYTPFKLDDKSRNEATRFFVVFTTGSEDIRYEYSFSYTAKEISCEELSVFPKGFKQTWFKRATENGVTHIKDSANFKIPEAVRPLVNDNSLLLSLLANYPKIKGHKLIAPVLNWFSEELSLQTRAPGADNDYPYSGGIINNELGTDYQRTFIQNIMRRADIGIASAKVVKQPMPEELRDFLKQLGTPSDETEDDLKTVVFRHEVANSEMELDYIEESGGTQQLFCLSGHIAKAIEQGSVLFIDEVDASLHPILAIEIINVFLNPISNPKGAQLIFTAHNPCLLENNLLRRDQIWFTEKNAEGATSLYPLSEYSPRKDETIISGYLAGRYSAIPVVPECFGRCYESLESN